MADQHDVAPARVAPTRVDPGRVDPGRVDPGLDDPTAVRPPGFEHLGWQPSWRDRLEGVLGGMSSGRLATGAAAAVVGVVVAAALVMRGPTQPPPELTLPVAGAAGDPAASTTTTTTASVAADVVVHAAGAVARPGVYRLAAGSRVADLLDAAGGPAPGADLDRVNLAAPLVDGERIFVPLPDQEVPPVSTSGGGASTPTDAPQVPVDLNAATLDELDALPGIGPATAQAILDERERRGRFTSVEELLDVRGIGDAKLAALRDLVRV